LTEANNKFTQQSLSIWQIANPNAQIEIQRQSENKKSVLLPIWFTESGEVQNNFELKNLFKAL
jgi:hypothetical protein